MAITQNELNDKYWEFERYMTYSRCDQLSGENGYGIYRGDVMQSVSAFIEFCCTGKVTDDDGKELL